MSLARKVVVLMGGGGQPTVVTLKPAEAAAIDTYTNEAAATTNYATAASFLVQATAGSRKLSLLKFDLAASIPAGSEIVSAKLRFYSNGNQTSNRTVNIHPILVANAAWTEAGATWNTLDGTNPWAGDTAGNGGTDAGCSVSGTDYAATAIGQLFFPANSGAGYKMETALDKTAVQAWLDGANYGMALAVVAGVLEMMSSVANEGGRPELDVSYFPT